VKFCVGSSFYIDFWRAAAFVSSLIHLLCAHWPSARLFITMQTYLPEINVTKNCCFITLCKAHGKVTHIKQQKYFHHLKRPGYNTEFLLYPRPFRWWKYIWCFICVTLLWALHIVIKQQFFTFIFAVLLLNLLYTNFLAKCCLLFLRQGWLTVGIVCQYHS